MIGTEKQVKWATDIKAGILGNVEEMRKRFEADATKAGQADTPAAAAGREMFDKCIANLNKVEDAKVWISMGYTPVSRKSIKEWATK